MSRLPATRPLSDILPKGAEGGKEFARIVDLLLFYRAQRSGDTLTLFNDAAGDFLALDSIGKNFRTAGNTGYQYKFFPSPLTDAHRTDIVSALKAAIGGKRKSKITRWILITPDDFQESATRKTGGDVSWFHNLKDSYPRVEIEHWGHKALQSLFLDTPSLCLYYYPELMREGVKTRKSIEEIRRKYDSNFDSRHRRIQFIGMSVYKQEAAKGVPMEHIYIPLRLLSEQDEDLGSDIGQTDPLTLLDEGSQSVILGDPGCGKSTLLRFLAMIGQTRPLQTRFSVGPDKHNRLPILVTLRRYADELKTRQNLSIFDFIVECTNGDFSLKSADDQFFSYYLETGRAILCFDGLDELPTPHFKQTIRERIVGFTKSYPGNTCIVTSRIVGYEGVARFDDAGFSHFKVAKLRLPEIERFISDWYAVREEDKQSRDDNIEHLLQIIRDPDHEAIFELSKNPLLLTIIALVHRIDAVLPDERVVLYSKCTETLLNTWHTWKHRDLSDSVSKNKIERRNRLRIEAIAYWMHERSVAISASERSVVPRAELKEFLIAFINETEKISESSGDAEDLADAFLEFVKGRAGLLIEAGDELFSFVHLTFQEYLAAARISTLCEKDGIRAIWDKISTRTASDRWQETIRLLIASFRSGDTKRDAVARMIEQATQNLSTQRASLLLGLLADSIEEAEESAPTILKLALTAMANSDDSSKISALGRRIQSLIRRNRLEISKLQSQVNELIDSWCHPKASEQTRVKHLSLAAITCGIKPNEIVKISTPLLMNGWENQFLESMNQHPSPIQMTNTQIDSLLLTATQLANHSPIGNLIGSCLLNIVRLDSDADVAQAVYRLLMAVLATGTHNGPFLHLSNNLMSIFFPAVCRAIFMKTASSKKAVRDPGQPPAILEIAEFQDLAIRARYLARLNGNQELRKLLKSLGVPSSSTDAITLGDSIRLSDRLPISGDGSDGSPGTFLSELFATSQIKNAVIDMVLVIPKLEPRAHWRSACTDAILTSLQVTEPAFQESTVLKVMRGEILNKNAYVAACLILFDACRAISSDEENGVLGQLIAAARLSELPHVRGASLLRDMAWNISPPGAGKDFMSDPSLRHLLLDSFWRIDSH